MGVSALASILSQKLSVLYPPRVRYLDGGRRPPEQTLDNGITGTRRTDIGFFRPFTAPCLDALENVET